MAQETFLIINVENSSSAPICLRKTMMHLFQDYLISSNLKQKSCYIINVLSFSSLLKVLICQNIILIDPHLLNGCVDIEKTFMKILFFPIIAY